jgi:hypothetical protein
MVPFSRGVRAAIGDFSRLDVTRPDLPAVRAPVPRLLAGVEPLGKYQGSGLTDATFLVRDPAGRVVQVSRLLHLVLSEIDGQHSVTEIAACVSTEFGRTVSTGNVEYLLDRKLAPLGLLARADGAPGPANPGWDQGVLTLNAPSLATTFARSLADQAGALAGQVGRADIPAALLSVISIILLVLPMAGLCCIMLITGRRLARYVIAVNRRRPVLWLPSVAAALLVATLLAGHWHLLPDVRTATPRPSAVGDITAQRPTATPAHPSPSPRPTARRVHRGVLLRPLSAHGFDPLDTQGDPNDENDGLAGYAIDGDPATAWRSQYYLGNPVFGGLKTGSGLILDMGRRVRLRSVRVAFGNEPGAGSGADVAIELGDSDTLAASTVGTFTTVGSADGVGGTHTFRTSSPARGRYLLIWFTRLPPVGPDRFQAEIYGITVRGSAVHRSSAP